MICPNDGTQMHQKVNLGKPMGGGVSTDDFYETWEIKECDTCQRIVKEYYSVKLL